MNIPLLKELLVNNITPLPSHDELRNELIGLPPTATIEDIDDVIEYAVDKVAGFKAATLRMSDTTLSPQEIAEVITKYNSYRNKIFIPTHSFIYIKLDTGGMTGYNSRHGKVGEKIFPVLRVTLMYEDKIFDQYVHPRELECYIEDDTRTYLERTGTLTKALASTIGITDVNRMIERWLDEVGVPKNMAMINRYVHGVSANTEFNNKFIYNHLPAVRNALCPNPVDINLILKSMESAGVPTVPMNVYVSDPVLYVREMQKQHRLLLQGLALYV